MQFDIGCEDDIDWTDFKYGDGKASCMDMTYDWCTNYGEYSHEAQRACPLTCGLCLTGIYNIYECRKSFIMHCFTVHNY